MSLKTDAIDARLEVILPQVVQLQDSYLANFGKCFQGLASHAVLPDGETAKAVDLTAHPNDQPHTYEDFWRRVHLLEPDEETGERTEQHEFTVSDLDAVKDLTVRTRFDVCQGPDHWAWTLTLDYEDETGHHAKTVNKEGTAQDWHLVEPEAEIEA
jgi:hypothetical protein